MPKRHPGIDQYIADAQPFARPILKHLRRIVHQAAPQAEEDLKWGMPTFLHNGKILCGLGAFKAHVAFWFWGGSKAVDDLRKEGEAMGNFGRITSLKDLPSSVRLKGYVKKAVKLAESKDPAKAKRGLKHPKPPLKTPPDLLRALRGSPRALKTFEAFSPSHKREYINWILEAKKQETRDRRVETAVDLMSEGKSMGWKYERPAKSRS